MEDLFKRLEAVALKQLEEAADYAEGHDGFKCPQMVDDVKDLAHLIKDMHSILGSRKAL